MDLGFCIVCDFLCLEVRGWSGTNSTLGASDISWVALLSCSTLVHFQLPDALQIRLNLGIPGLGSLRATSSSSSDR